MNNRHRYWPGVKGIEEGLNSDSFPFASFTIPLCLGVPNFSLKMLSTIPITLSFHCFSGSLVHFAFDSYDFIESNKLLSERNMFKKPLVDSAQRMLSSNLKVWSA